MYQQMLVHCSPRTEDDFAANGARLAERVVVRVFQMVFQVKGAGVSLGADFADGGSRVMSA